MKWCWDNELRIYPQPLTSTGSRMKIVVEKKGSQKMGDEVFNDIKKITKKINDLYTQIFNKNQNKTF